MTPRLKNKDDIFRLGELTFTEKGRCSSRGQAAPAFYFSEGKEER